MATSRKAVLLILLLTQLSCPVSASPWTSRTGLFQASYESDLEPIVINAIHSWTLRVYDRDGAPVEGASITVEGGMPIHDHGLPTAPRVTRELKPGHYRLEGLRFHMTGAWELVVTIESGDTRDIVIIPLNVRNP